MFGFNKKGYYKYESIIRFPSDETGELGDRIQNHLDEIRLKYIKNKKIDQISRLEYYDRIEVDVISNRDIEQDNVIYDIYSDIIRELNALNCRSDITVSEFKLVETDN